MGHLNVGFYVAKSMEGLIGLAAEIGMPGPYDYGSQRGAWASQSAIAGSESA